MSPPLPTPRRERWPYAVAGAIVLSGVLLIVLGFGALRKDARVTPAAAAVVMPAQPAAAPAQVPAAESPAPAAAAPEPVTRTLDERRFAENDTAHVRADWVAGFYPIYAIAQKTYGVNWLLIASVHKQETAFSTHPTTYQGLNFANCCAGPMQFNLTNGPVSTWERYQDAFKRAQRPAAYPHQTTEHPSVYDDFDAIMAAAALLRDNGAGLRLDAGAWTAAYNYYGHDLSGVDYADQVLARALGWGRDRFCINCGLDGRVLGAVTAAWGAPVRARHQDAA